MRRVSLYLVPLIGSFACAAQTSVTRPIPPSRTGTDPAIGKTFVLKLEDDVGGGTELRGVTGRVTVACVLGPSEALRVQTRCTALARRFADRLAVVALDVRGPKTLHAEPPAAPAPNAPEVAAPAQPPLPFRTFSDPEGEALRKGLGLSASSRVIVIDPQGRVDALFAPNQGGLEEAVRQLVD